MNPALSDPAWREREYSPSSAIGGNYAPHIARYVQDSATARESIPLQADRRYGDAPRALIDFFPAPKQQSVTGLLVFIHGGYWQELSKNESCFLAPAWHEAGFAHAVIGYTLAPSATLPQIVDECVAALNWLKAQATSLGFDQDRIVVAGSSAGAYLAAACATRVSLKGIVPISGIFDVAPLIGTSINVALRLNPVNAAALNLMTTTSQLAPSVVAYGEIETSEFKRQSRSFAALLNERGVNCECFEIPQRNHFDVVHELSDNGTRLFAATFQLFNR
ncbi:MAG: alpha/beta hydrolase [Betaproteobacteria bacterium]|nr:MAG: alpha/beta hydrolase [Betaproteobacteria bacterium]